MENTKLDSKLLADLSWNEAANSWPISTYVWLVTPRNSSVYCLPITQVAGLVEWILTSSEAQEINSINYGVHP